MKIKTVEHFIRIWARIYFQLDGDDIYEHLYFKMFNEAHRGLCKNIIKLRPQLKLTKRRYVIIKERLDKEDIMEADGSYPEQRKGYIEAMKIMEKEYGLPN